MADAHRFETTLAWPASPTQKLPPEPGFSRDNTLAASGRPPMPYAPGGDAAAALALHDRAHAYCFMANSVNFTVRHEPPIVED